MAVPTTLHIGRPCMQCTPGHVHGPGGAGMLSRRGLAEEGGGGRETRAFHGGGGQEGRGRGGGGGGGLTYSWWSGTGMGGGEGGDPAIYCDPTQAAYPGPHGHEDHAGPCGPPRTSDTVSPGLTPTNAPKKAHGGDANHPGSR